MDYQWRREGDSPFGFTGDWIIRAVVSDQAVPTLPMTWVISSRFT